MAKSYLFIVLGLVLFGCTGQEPGLRLASPVEPPHIALPPRATLPDVTPAPLAVAPTARQCIVLLTIDGVRWQEVFNGVDRRLAREHGLGDSEVVGPGKLVPALHALATGEGAAIGAPDHGAPISASDAAVKSLPGYMEITSGRPVTDCSTNHCPRIRETTLLDELAARPGAEPGDVAAVASWPAIARAAAARPLRILLSAGRTSGENLELLRFDAAAKRLFTDGTRSRPGPGFGDYRPDRYTAPIALRYLRVKRPRFLFIALGDPDEWGHKNKYRRYLAALHRADAVVGKVVRTLASLHQRGWSTALLVTADHGRDPECKNHGGVASAARTWLVAGGSLIRAHGLVDAPAPRFLADIAPTLRRLMGVTADSDARAGHVLEELIAPDDHARVARLARD